MLFFTENEHDCVSCGACVAVCPVHCISMKKNEEGFLYPMASEQCIHCGRCRMACPMIESDNLNVTKPIKQAAYCAVTKDNEIWKRSASGGAFSEICKAFGDSDTIICGASWDGLRVHHVCVKGVDRIAPLCKSKYVASDTDNVFVEIKNYIRNGTKVIFCGTPCQVAGLKKVIGKDVDNLLLVDLICHGVGSPDVFISCIEQIEEQFGRKVKSYEFRAKRTSFENDHIQKILTENKEQLYLVNDPYIQLFLEQICLRPSCGKNCKFRCEKRQGDITIADFKGLTNVFPRLIGAKKNYSSIILNTQKGYSILTVLQKTMEMYLCSIDDIKKYNPLFYKHTWFSDKRDMFFSEYKKNPKSAIEQYTEPAKLLKIGWKKRIWMFLPKFIRNAILAIYSGGGVTLGYDSCVISKIVFK